MSVMAQEYEAALQATAAFFEDRQTRPGVVARRLLGIPTTADETLRSHLVAERRRRTRMDGGIAGWMFATTWSAWELLQLGCPPDHAGVHRMVGFLLKQQDQPGRFGEGCTARRHAAGQCHHVIGGFFSPGRAENPIAPLTFPNGAVVRGEWDARFAASCFTLRTVLQARREARPPVRRHIESLLFLQEGWRLGRFEAPLDLGFFALGALSLAPIEYRRQVERMIDHLTEFQQPDGSWPDASLFHVLDVLLSTPTPATREALRRSAPVLLARQRSDGTFDDDANEERALIGLRVLRFLGVGRTTPRPPRYSLPTGALRPRRPEHR